MCDRLIRTARRIKQQQEGRWVSRSAARITFDLAFAPLTSIGRDRFMFVSPCSVDEYLLRTPLLIWKVRMPMGPGAPAASAASLHASERLHHTLQAACHPPTPRSGHPLVECWSAYLSLVNVRCANVRIHDLPFRTFLPPPISCIREPDILLLYTKVSNSQLALTDDPVPSLPT